MWRWIVSYAVFEAVAVLGALSVTIWRSHRRRHPLATPPPPGFQPTTERVIDPTTGVLHEVWFNTSTGERIYRPLQPPAGGVRGAAGARTRKARSLRSQPRAGKRRR